MNIRTAALATIGAVLASAIAGPVVDASETTYNAITRQFASDVGDKKAGEKRQSKAGDSVPIAKCIEDIDAAVRINKQRTLSVIVINTDVAATTLEQEKVRTGFTFGEIYVAHSLALATRKKFDAIAKLRKSGKTWEQIAREHNVTLKGSRELIRQIRENA
jgi:hypothetical protein